MSLVALQRWSVIHLLGYPNSSSNLKNTEQVIRLLAEAREEEDVIGINISNCATTTKL
jgi:hypothetical protein